MIIISFKDSEELFFQQTVALLSDQFGYTPTIISEQKYDFSIDQFTRTFINNKGQKVYLTAKEFDLFYLLFTHKGQVFSKEQLYENVWGYNHIYDSRNVSDKLGRGIFLDHDQV